MVSLYKPYIPEDLPELDNILQSGDLSYGKWGKKFENGLADYICNDRIVIVNSYNSAALVAISTLGLKYGDEVIASPMSCLASNQPLITQGLKIIWSDIDPLTGTLDPDDVVKKITSKTRAILHNHFCGYVGYIDEINMIGKTHGIFVIDDCIEAFGSEYKGKKLGNVGSDVSIFSFQTVRLPNCIDGGGIVFNDKHFYEKSILIRDYGINRSLFRDKFGEISPLCDISDAGFGATLNEINSYIGFQQMKDISFLINKQRKNSIYWNRYLDNRNEKIDSLKVQDNTVPNYWVFGILAKNKVEVMHEIRKTGFYSSSVHLNNNNYSIFGDKTILKGVKEFSSKFIAVPSGWWLELN